MALISENMLCRWNVLSLLLTHDEFQADLSNSFFFYSCFSFTFFLKLEKSVIHTAIKSLNKKGLKTDEIHTEMVNQSGNYAPSRAKLFNWLAKFKRGRSDIIMRHAVDV